MAFKEIIRPIALWPDHYELVGRCCLLALGWRCQAKYVGNNDSNVSLLGEDL